MAALMLLEGYEHTHGARHLLDVWRMAERADDEETALRAVYAMGYEPVLHPAGLPRLEGN